MVIILVVASLLAACSGQIQAQKQANPQKKAPKQPEYPIKTIILINPWPVGDSKRYYPISQHYFSRFRD